MDSYKINLVIAFHLPAFAYQLTNWTKKNCPDYLSMLETLWGKTFYF